MKPKNGRNRTIPTAPRCLSCAEAVAGLGRFCSGCGSAVGTELHARYAEYLQGMHRLGVMGVVHSTANTDGANTVAERPRVYQEEQYEGARDVFVSHEPPPSRGDSPGSPPGRLAEAPRPPVTRPPPPFRPSQGPHLNSTPLKATQFATTNGIEKLCKPNKIRFKSLGTVTFTEPQNGRHIRLQGNASEKRLRLTADNPRTAEIMTKVTFHFQPPAISTPSNMYFRLPPAEEDREVVVARLFALANCCDVIHNIPPPPPQREALTSGGKAWLVPQRRIVMGKEKLDGIVKRLHDDSSAHQQRESRDLASKYAMDQPKAKVGKLNDINERLYYTQVANKVALHEKIETELAALPFCKSAQIDAETLQASTARLYTESVERDAAKRQELNSKYLPTPPRVPLSSPEAMKEQVKRLYDAPKERQQEIRQELYTRYVAPSELKSKKLTAQEMGECVGRLAKGSS